MIERRHSEHDHKVERIAEQLRSRRSDKPLSLKKKSVAHQVPKLGDLRRSDEKIDVSDLTSVLHIDVERRLCVAEAGVTFVDLVAATMRHGLVPIIVPELKTITIGGAVCGCSIESASFRHGGFHDTCLEYEIITAKGQVITCRPDGDDGRALVFQMMHGSFGTLGILTKLTFRLIPAKAFVKVVYEKHTTLQSYLQSIAAHEETHDCDYMDGIIHSPSLYVLSIGHFVDSAPYTHRYDWMKVYYRSTAVRTEDYLRTADYFFRYDRGVTNVHPKSWLARLLFGKWMGSSTVLRLAERLDWLFLEKHNDMRSPTMTLDVFLPISRVVEFLTWYERELGYYPLWCVPYKRMRDYEWIGDELLQKITDPLFVDLAIYGMKPRTDKNYHRLMEEKLAELGGIKTLIAHNYYSEDEFWRLWNKPNYDAVKAVTDPDNVFRDLYTKTCKAAMGLR